MSHHIVGFNNVYYAYPDNKQAVAGVSFLIRHGESVGLVGPNGAGKSTLLMLLTGILLPAAGEIRVGETPVTKKTLPHIRRNIGFSFQNPDDQLFMNTVYDDVAFGPRNYGMNEAEVEDRVMRALRTMGAEHLKDRAPYKLSGGEKRTAAIAAVLSMDPGILLLDEPTSELDPRSRRRLITILKGFTHTKIIATHDLDMVLEICDRTIVLSNGGLVADGLTGEVLTNNELMEQSGLEIPLSIQNCPLCGSRK